MGGWGAGAKEKGVVAWCGVQRRTRTGSIGEGEKGEVTDVRKVLKATSAYEATPLHPIPIYSWRGELMKRNEA